MSEMAAEELPGPRLGRGARWSLRAACLAGREAPDEAEKFRVFTQLRLRCEALLQQALTCSDLADVSFDLDDGPGLVRGHRAVLGAVSEGFMGMFSHAMREQRSSTVRITGVSAQSWRGFLEWAYLGTGREECSKADGRELYVLAEMYQVPGLKDWLLLKGLNRESLVAAIEFGMLPEGDRGELLEKCRDSAKYVLGYSGVGDWGESLKGVSIETVFQLLEAYTDGSRNGVSKDGFEMAEMTLGHICTHKSTAIRDGSKNPEERSIEFVLSWWRANPGVKPSLVSSGDSRDTSNSRADERSVAGVVDEWLDKLMALIDWERVSTETLKKEVSPSGLLSAERLVQLYESRIMRKDLGSIDAKYFQGSCCFTAPNSFPHRQFAVDRIALGRSDEILAATDLLARVCVYDTSTAELLHSMCGHDGFPNEPWAFDRCHGLVYYETSSGSHDLYVAVEPHLQSNQILVFDAQLQYKFGFGVWGCRPGEMCHPDGLSFTKDGLLLVADSENFRVQVLKPDGAFVSMISTRGPMSGLAPAVSLRPVDPHSCPKQTRMDVAAGPRGSVVVAIKPCSQNIIEHGLQVFTAEGNLIWALATPANAVAVTKGGEIIACLLDHAAPEPSNDIIAIFTLEGIQLQVLCNQSFSFRTPVALAVCTKGTIYVGDVVLERVMEIE